MVNRAEQSSQHNDQTTHWTTMESDFDSHKHKGFYSSPQYADIVGPTQPPIQWAPGVLPYEFRGQEKTTDPHVNSKVKNKQRCISTPLYIFMPWAFISNRGKPHTSLTLRRLMSYIYGAPILDVSRSHTTTQHSR